MKKKTKIIGTVFALCTSLCMLVVGVLAASQVSLNVSSSVSFESSGVYVKVKGEVQKGNDTTEPTRASEPSGSDYYYIGYSYDAQDEEQESDTQASDYNDTPVGTSSYTPMTTWTIGDVEFSETENIIRYSLTFTNYSEKDIQATITTNKDTFMQDPDVQGKVEIEETSTSIIIGGYQGGTAQTGTYTITMKLTNFSSSFTNKSLTIDVSFLTYSLNYNYFIIENDIITGLSNEYKNLETKPEILIVPGYSKETGAPLSIGDDAFNALSSSTVIIQEGIKTIGNRAFYNCSDLTSVTIPDSITSIGASAFESCSKLTSVTIPEGVTSIENSTFESCSNLTSVTIPDSITSIGASAFYGCSGLTSITIPENVTSIGAYAFNGCSKLNYNEYENGKYLGNTNNPYMVLVDTINNTFTAFTINDGCKLIYDSAFSYCRKLKSITIPEGVTSIGDDAFYYCSSLTSITIPESVTSIGSAFSDCSGLKRVNISSLEKWCEITFSGNWSNPLYYAHNLYLNNKLVTEITIPESETSIGAYAFNGCSSLKSVTIPEGVTSIGYSAFEHCSGLTSITIPESVTSIGLDAFNNCIGLKGVYITSLEKWCKITFSTNSNPLYYAQNLYLNNELVTEIIIPESVTSIGDYTFSGCSSLTSVTIPDSVTSIGAFAFESCSKLTSVTIPESVTSIGGGAFKKCFGLTGITIPEGVTSIGNYTFESCSNLTSVTIPDSVTSIGNNAFKSCSKLKSVTIPEGVTSIGGEAFRSCGALTNITIPEGVTSIETCTFYDCRSLTNITIPGSVTSIGRSAFVECRSLTSITILEGVTSIRDYAFEYCTSITSITIPESVTSIGDDAFNFCTSLKYIHLKGNLKSKYYSTFVKTDSADEPTDWTSTVGYMQSAGYYHQKSAYESAA